MENNAHDTNVVCLSVPRLRVFPAAPIPPNLTNSSLSLCFLDPDFSASASHMLAETNASSGLQSNQASRGCTLFCELISFRAPANPHQQSDTPPKGSLLFRIKWTKQCERNRQCRLSGANLVMFSQQVFCGLGVCDEEGRHSS